MSLSEQNQDQKVGVLAAISAVQADLAKSGVGKDQRNTMQNYQFRGIDDIYNALGPLLPKHGLVILPRMIDRSVTTHPTKSGGTMFHVTLKAEFRFKAISDGSEEIVEVYGESMDTSDKATNKAMSACFKYAMIQTFCIPVQGEPDADSDNPTVGAKPVANKPKFGKLLTDEEADSAAQARYDANE